MEQYFSPSSNASTSVYLASDINITKTAFIIPGEDCRVPWRTSLPTSPVSHVKTVTKFPFPWEGTGSQGVEDVPRITHSVTKLHKPRTQVCGFPTYRPVSCSNNSKVEKPEKNELYLPWMQRQLASHYVLEGTGNLSAFQGMEWSINHENR